MAKGTSAPEIADDSALTGRLRKLTVSNFRAIGPTPVEIDLDKIVVLVGPNNSGKSSILRAYELAMSLGKEALISLEDFHNGDTANVPVIELVSEVEKASEKWIYKDASGNSLIKERWVFGSNGKPVRSGWNAKEQKWDDKKPFGLDAVAQQRRPKPHYIKAFDTPERQEEEISELVLEVIRERARTLPDANGVEGGELRKITAEFVNFQAQILNGAKGDIDALEAAVTALIANVFSGHEVKIEIDTKPKKDLQLFDGTHRLRVGPKAGYMSPLVASGSGTRRTALWSLLSVAASKKANGKSHLLLLDEPEICLHPDAVRQASKVMYDLAEAPNWQVMVTTHSPVFIDLSRDNKTIIRVDRKTNGDVTSTTLFRPSKAQLGVSDKENLKLLTLYDPTLGEFFFGGYPIVVEGDTEYVALKFVIKAILDDPKLSTIDPSILRSLQIIRARGKAPIVSVVKILNQFGAKYAVLHDTDTPEVTKKKDGKETKQVNPAWTMNKSIRDEILAGPDAASVRYLVSEPNFEMAYLEEGTTKEKPYHAIQRMKENPDALRNVTALLSALIDFKAPVPKGAKDGRVIGA